MIKKYPKNSKKQLSKNFNAQEFKCKCKSQNCTVIYIDTDLIDALQKKRDKWGLPVEIVSGFRCAYHNEKVGGKSGSFHLTGKAVDIKVKGMTAKQIADDCEDMDGLGRANTFTHIDIRGYKARWKY